MLNLKSKIGTLIGIFLWIFLGMYGVPFWISGSAIVSKAAVDSVVKGESDLPEKSTTAQVSNKCESVMKNVAVKQLKGFMDFLETNFQNKSSTSSLLNLAFAQYRVMRRELFITYNKYYPNQGASQIVTGVEPAACLKILNETSGVKKSTALLQKYQSINDLLGVLHQQFIFLKGYLDTFSTKLPCYVKEQCLKG